MRSCHDRHHLDFLSNQQVRLLEEMRGTREEMGQMRDDIRVMAAIVQRLDDTVQGLVNEVRGATGGRRNG